MAKEIQIDVIINTADAAKTINEVEQSLKDVNEAMKNLEVGSREFNQLKKKSSELTDKLEKQNQTLKNNTSVMSKMGNVVKGVGKAFAGLGIGAVIGFFAALGSAMMKNQKIMNAVNTVLGTISIVFSQLTDIIIGVYENVSKSSEKFDGLKKVIGGLMTLALTPLKLSFYSIKLAIQELQLGWEESFLGDKDPKTIKDLNARIKETKDNLVEVGKDGIGAVKDVALNLGEAITEGADIVSEVVDKASKISVKAAYNTAKANVAIEDSAKKAAAEQGRLAEKYDRQAEKQRQIRDDESKSIAERQKANEALGKILDEQEKAMIKQADLQVADAKAKLAANNNTENSIALTEALANREGVLAQIEGLRSEQLVNRIALKKEENELNKAVSDAEIKSQITQLDFEAEMAKTPEERLAKEKASLEKQKELLEQDIVNKRLLYAEGTQSRIDADIAYKEAKQAIENGITKNEKEQSDLRVEQAKTEKEKKLEEAKKEKEEKIKTQYETVAAFQEIGNAFVDIANTNTQKEIDSAKKRYDSEIQLAQKNGQDTTEIENRKNKEISELEKKLFERKKKTDIANSIINGAVAITKTIAQLGGLGAITPPGIAILAAMAATTVAQIAAISAQKYEGGSSSASSSPNISGGNGNIDNPNVTPSNSAIFGTGTQVSGTVKAFDSKKDDLRVYVLEEDVTEKQRRNNKIKVRSSLK